MLVLVRPWFPELQQNLRLGRPGLLRCRQQRLRHHRRRRQAHRQVLWRGRRHHPGEPHPAQHLQGDQDLRLPGHLPLAGERKQRRGLPADGKTTSRKLQCSANVESNLHPFWHSTALQDDGLAFQRHPGPNRLVHHPFRAENPLESRLDVRFPPGGSRRREYERIHLNDFQLLL